MIDIHRFNLYDVQMKNHLDFYGYVRMINFIRQSVRDLKCIYCLTIASSGDDLNYHMACESHFKLPDDPQKFLNDDRWVKYC